MKINIPNQPNSPLRNIMRQTGYFENYDRRSEQVSYIRSLGRNRYPRFHIYVKNSGDEVVFNLHIDQKQASYRGHSAHSGEYDSEVVLREGERLRRILTGLMVHQPSVQNKVEGVASYDDEEGGFFKKLFGR